MIRVRQRGAEPALLAKSKQDWTARFQSNTKGKDWATNVATVLGYRNVSKLIEEFIENNRNSPSQMVSDMVELFDLRSVKTAVEQQMELANEHEQNEISAGYVP